MDGKDQLTQHLLVALIERSLQPTPPIMLPTHPHSSALALPVSATGGSHVVAGSVAHLLFLAGIIVVGQLAALDIIIVLVLVSILISLLLG